MSSLRIWTAAEQVAAHLRAEITSGRLGGIMPGVLRLEAGLGVNRNTLEAALRLLEHEGLLAPQGAGRRRRIEAPASGASARPLRVAILVYEAADRKIDYMVDLKHELEVAGQVAFYAEKPLLELRMEVKRIARMVARTEADAWVVMAGSREVLEWFPGQGIPVFALFGRLRAVPVAGVGPDKPPAHAAATRHLIGLGHRRIVLLARRLRRLPKPGASEQAFLNELAAHGIEPGSYHLPDWEESVEGFHARLDALFRVMPPTALIIQEAFLFTAARNYLAGRGIRVPEDVSLVCTDNDPTFAWCRPTIAHIRWDSAPVVRRVVRWAGNVARGRKDRRQTLTPAEFVPGGTVGLVRMGG